MHPLINNLHTFNENELEIKIKDLTAKYWKCNNSSLQYQISMILESYNAELSKRRAESWTKLNKDKNGMFDGLININ